MDATLKENEAVLFIDRKRRRYLKRLRAGRKITIRGDILADDLFGLPEGSQVKLSYGRVLPGPAAHLRRLGAQSPRQAQVIYPKDTGPMLLWGDVFPGATVIEGGIGAGALTIALLRAVGPHGRVISYELREDFAKMARDNVAAFFGDAPQWTLKIGDLYEGFEETNVDRMFLDVAEPGRAMAVAARALAPAACWSATFNRDSTQGHGRRTTGRSALRRSGKLRDPAAALAGQGTERAPAPSHGRPLRVHNRRAQTGELIGMTCGSDGQHSYRSPDFWSSESPGDIQDAPDSQPKIS